MSASNKQRAFIRSKVQTPFFFWYWITKSIYIFHDQMNLKQYVWKYKYAVLFIYLIFFCIMIIFLYIIYRQWADLNLFVYYRQIEQRILYFIDMQVKFKLSLLFVLMNRFRYWMHGRMMLEKKLKWTISLIAY